MTSPASISAVTISPSPWSHECSVSSPTSAVRVRVRARDREDQRRLVLPVRVGQPQLAGRHALVLEDVHDRMRLGDEEDPARRDEMRHDPGPRPDVGQPAEDAARRVDDVEVALERRRQVVQVRFDEACLREAELDRQRARQLDRRRRDVGAGHPRAQTCPRQRVDPEMALQVEERLARSRRRPARSRTAGSGRRPP